MKVIEQLIEFLRNTGSLSESDLAQLRDQGFLPTLTQEWYEDTGYDYEYDYEYEWYDDYGDELEEEELLRKLSVRDQQRRSAGKKSRKKRNTNEFTDRVAALVNAWTENQGRELMRNSFGMSGHWRSDCVQISNAPDEDLRAILLRSQFSDVVDWLLFDPVWAVTNSKLFSGLDKAGKKVCRSVADRMLRRWHRAQIRICKSLADIALASPGLFDMIGWRHSEKHNSHDTFVWLLLAGKLLKCRKTPPGSLSAMTLPMDSILTFNRYFWTSDETLSQEELWELSLVVKSMVLSEELVQELVGYPEIRFRWEEIPVEVHGRLQRFLSKNAWWML